MTVQWANGMEFLQWSVEVTPIFTAELPAWNSTHQRVEKITPIASAPVNATRMLQNADVYQKLTSSNIQFTM